MAFGFKGIFQRELDLGKKNLNGEHKTFLILTICQIIEFTAVWLENVFGVPAREPDIKYCQAQPAADVNFVAK